LAESIEKHGSQPKVQKRMPQSAARQQPLGGLIGAGMTSIMRPMLSLGPSLAAGAMLFVISHEIIPGTHHQKGHETIATVSLMIGFILMMMFDTMLA